MGSDGMSILDFARFRVGSGTSQLGIVEKYIKGREGGFFASSHYQEARLIITKYHNDHLSDAWLHDQAQELLAVANASTNKETKSRLLDNHKAIIAYYYNEFRKRELRIISGKRMKLRLDGLLVTGVASFVAIENGKILFIKPDFSKKQLKNEFVRTVLSCMYWAYYLGKLPITSASFQYWNIPKGKGVRVEDIGIIEIGELNKLAFHFNEMRKNILTV